MKIAITSNGTTEGTKVKMDGAELTAEDNVVEAHFNASVRYGKWVRFGYSTKNRNEDGSYEITSYEYESPDDSEDQSEAVPVIRKTTTPEGLGKEAMDELLINPHTIGEAFVTVIDRSQIPPQHRAAVAEYVRSMRVKGEHIRVVDGEKSDDDSG